MRSLFNSLLSYFLTPGGLLLMGALDSSVVFFLPLGIDFVVVILTARKPELFWIYALLATAGSMIGASLTFWIGRKVGGAGLSRLLKPATMKRVEQRVNNSAAYSVALLGIIPPPFPFTAFVLMSGACRVNPWQFLAALGGVRLVRFFIEAGLAARYGRGILAWMQSTTFTVAVIALSVLAGIGTIVSAVSVIRSARSKSRSGSAVAQQLPRTPPAAPSPP
ncbi:MAG: VTT domain-containing protein [Vicinamibacterales bacterium]